MRLAKYTRSFLILTLAACCGLSQKAAALPFNTDMYHPQPMTGEVARPKSPNSVPMGSHERRVEKREDALKLHNPIKGDALSVANGERLFTINCSPCHGTYSSDGTQTPSWFVGQLPAPNLALPLYWEHETDATGMGRTDGNVYGTIHLGSVSTLMPAYGWKLSPTEHWDIVNYLRTFQEAKKKLASK